jgi:hypothetical protein
MSWWWPFKKQEAAQAELEFRESLSEALLRQDDLLAATERLKESRTSSQPRRASEEGGPADTITRARNA